MRRVWLACLAIPIVLSSGLALAQLSDDVVKIGVLTDLSGPAPTATGLGSVAAAQMAVDDFGGKVLGKPVTVISADHQIKPDVAAGIARQWYDADHVDLIVDVPVSAVGLAVQQVANDRKKLFITIRPVRPISTANSARLTRCNGCSTLMRSPLARLRKWSSAAAIHGSSSPPTMHSAIRSSTTPRK